MTQNYYLEYRLIPSLLNEVKLGRNPLESLIDTRWIKETLTNNNVDIEWNGFPTASRKGCPDPDRMTTKEGAEKPDLV